MKRGANVQTRKQTTALTCVNSHLNLKYTCTRPLTHLHESVDNLNSKRGTKIAVPPPSHPPHRLFLSKGYRIRLAITISARKGFTCSTARSSQHDGVSKAVLELIPKEVVGDTFCTENISDFRFPHDRLRLYTSYFFASFITFSADK